MSSKQGKMLHKIIWFIVTILYSFCMIGMQPQSPRVYDQEATHTLKSLLNLYNPVKGNLPEQEIYRLVIAGADPSIRADCGRHKGYDWVSALFSGGEQSQATPNVISFLFQEGVDPNGNSCDVFPLQQACINGSYMLSLQLINSGAKIRRRNKAGFSALDYAAGNNRLAIAKLLLDSGAAPDIDIPNNKNGQTPLTFAIKEEHHDMVELLKRYLK